MKDKSYPPLALLVVAAFLAPIIGGYVSTDASPITAGSSPWLLAVMGDAAAPVLSHAIIALPILVALAWVLWQRQIQQIPSQKLSVLLLLFFGVVLVSVGFSRFKAVSLVSATEWLTYGAATFAVVSAAGRRRGVLAILLGLFGGCVLASLRGIVEYGESADRTWRIFGGWIGPNALAAMLLIGLFIGLGLMLTQKGLQALLVGIGVALIGFALVLTQSKGGLLACGFGGIVLIITLVLWRGKAVAIDFARMASVAAAIVGLSMLLTLSNKAATSSAPGAAPPGASTPLDRFANAGQTQEQSVGFRRLLWKSSIDIWRTEPIGVGIGAFRHSSSKPGLVTQTQLAHESYLQLLAEAGLFAPILLLAAFGFWTWLLFRGARGVAPDRRALRAGVFAAVMAVCAHSFVDSDLHYYGVGVSVFMLLGVGLLLSSDAVAPEFTPKGLRGVTAGGIAVLAVSLLYFGWAEALRASVRGFLAAGDRLGAQQAMSSLSATDSWDGETLYLAGITAASNEERVQILTRAVDLAPSTRNIRTLARAQIATNNPEDAIHTLGKALTADPNNLPALKMLLGLYTQVGDTGGARTVAERLLKVEDTPYFKIRSEPDIVPMETTAARLYLATTAKPAERVALLQGALDLYRSYAARTLPQVIAINRALPGKDFGGESIQSAAERMNEAHTVALDLEKLYRSRGQFDLATKVAADGQGFADALGKLGVPDK